jgi:AraC-like DNA-binding protein
MGAGFSASAIHVTFEAPESDPVYSRVFGSQVVFRQSANRFVYDAAWLNGSPRFGNEITYGSVLTLCDDLEDRLRNRVGLTGKARAFLLANLGRHASLEDVAAHLGAPVRTLRRKLREEDTSFRELFDQLRAEVATRYLRDTEMTMDDIAEALGFSDAANFRHAFHRWNRVSPLEVRRSLQVDRIRA